MTTPTNRGIRCRSKFVIVWIIFVHVEDTITVVILILIVRNSIIVVVIVIFVKDSSPSESSSSMSSDLTSTKVRDPRRRRHKTENHFMVYLGSSLHRSPH